MRTFSSLGARIYGVAALSGLAMVLLGTLLLQVNYKTRDGFGWVGHTQDVIISLDQLQSNLGEAESGLRGYLMTGDESYLSRFDYNLQQAGVLRESIVKVVSDNSDQTRRALTLRRLAKAKAEVMVKAMVRARTMGVQGAALPSERNRARSLMQRISLITEVMREDERVLLVQRTAEANRTSAQLRSLLIFGIPLLLLLLATVAWQIRASIARPLADLLDAVTRFGNGDRTARAQLLDRSGSAEFRSLASAYNDMAERLTHAIEQSQQAEGQLASANAELRHRGEVLQARQQSIELLSDMAHRLQAIQGEGELSEVLNCFLPKVFPDLAGALYIHNHSRNLLVRRSAWGEPYAKPECFQPNQCWGLRRGQTHAVDQPGADIVCAHAAGGMPVERLCEPVIAGGEVLGLIYVEGLTEPEQRFRLDMLMENVALALVNDNLRSRLREQSIRDPLTKLFNRRYLEEAMQLETARAQRNASPLAVVMADVDHFKRFNDTHGHEAGDALLKSVAGQIQSQFRHGDIVCRYGGEEFTVIAPGASAELICSRVEKLRQAVGAMTVDYRGQRLGPVTMSFGVDVWTAGQSRAPESLIGEADRALYRAKKLGRNRVELVPEPAGVQAGG